MHPKLKRAYADMNPAEKTNDDECRKLAAFFLDDFNRCGSLEQSRREFGEFDAHRDSVADLQSNDEEAAAEPQKRPKITDYVHSKFQVLCTAGCKLSNAGTNEAFREESSRSGPPRKLMRMTVAHADVATDVQDAMRIAEHALERDDGVHMACAPFEKFAVQPEIQALYGKVSLVLTDPPYNTRREAGATNSEHDKFSSTDMQKAADLIANLLRPYGHAFIFCSYQQSFEWRKALLSADGGSFLKVPAVPEVIVRDPAAVNQSGNFRYHRLNVVEYAWDVYKDRTSTGGNYGATVGFGNPNLQLISGSSMHSYVNTIDRYIPPKAPELLRSDGNILRPEQKSVALLRDIIRLFAPEPAGIIVDLFAGTMSTVVAALQEGRPVYACEKFEDCFNIGQQRVRNFQ